MTLSSKRSTVRTPSATHFFSSHFFLFYRISCNSINKNKNNTPIQHKWMLVPVVYTLRSCSRGPRFDPQADIFLPFIFRDAPIWSQKTWKRRHKKVRSPSGYFFCYLYFVTPQYRHKKYVNGVIKRTKNESSSGQYGHYIL